MCKRYSRAESWTDLEQLLGLLEITDPTDLAPSYNVAPTQLAPVIRAGSKPGSYRGSLLRWGFEPAWSDDPTIASRLSNARAETLHAKPTFRTAFAKQRCLVPVSGFFEWDQSTSPSTPYHFRRESGEPFMLAGLWEPGTAPRPDTFTIITTEPNDLVRPIHHRMPAIIPPELWPIWLGPTTHLGELRPMLQTPRAAGFVSHRVSKLVNKATNTGPAVATPAARSDQNPELLF